MLLRKLPPKKLKPTVLPPKKLKRIVWLLRKLKLTVWPLRKLKRTVLLLKPQRQKNNAVEKRPKLLLRKNDSA